jgi:hypothetical protein
MRSFSVLAIALMLLLGGCYTFRGQKAGAIKSIAIPLFENETAEFGLAERVTDALITGFQRDGTLRVTSSEQADAILQGRVLTVEDLPYTARSDQAAVTVEEYRFSLNCTIELINSRTQEPIWSQSFPMWAIYSYSSGSLANRDQAIQEAVEKLQQDLLNKIVGSW